MYSRSARISTALRNLKRLVSDIANRDNEIATQHWICLSANERAVLGKVHKARAAAA